MKTRNQAANDDGSAGSLQRVVRRLIEERDAMRNLADACRCEAAHHWMLGYASGIHYALAEIATNSGTEASTRMAIDADNGVKQKAAGQSCVPEKDLGSAPIVTHPLETEGESDLLAGAEPPNDRTLRPAE